MRDIIGAFSVMPPHLPRTIEQLMGFFTALSAIAGAVVGLTAKSHHSMGRKLMHMLISAFGVAMIILR